MNRQKKIVDELRLALSLEGKKPLEEIEPKELIKEVVDEEPRDEFKTAQQRLVKLGESIRSTQSSLKQKRSELANKANQIEELRDRITKQEEDFLIEQINQIENTEAHHAIHKLIHNKICPSCGNHNEDLHQKATEFIKNNQCPLCGTPSSYDGDSAQPELEATLTELVKAKIQIEQQIIELEAGLDELMEESVLVNDITNKLLLKRPSAVVYVQKDAPPSAEALKNNESALGLLEQELRELRIQFNTLQKELDETYKSFAQLNNTRVERLGELYSEFASDFLGVDCTLEPITDDSDFLDLNLFVPKFLGKTRKRPTSCSEAQRFFLDIAFRMAVIELSYEMSSHHGTFICETPENALDISYINNVAEMFSTFSIENKNTLILSSNIQPGGVAETLLTRLEVNDRPDHFLDMIEIGKLSEVQANGLGAEAIEEVMERILNEPRFS